MYIMCVANKIVRIYVHASIQSLYLKHLLVNSQTDIQPTHVTKIQAFLT